MKYAKLGNTDIEVSRLCVGCMSFGEHIEGGHQWTLDQDATQEMVRHALEVGVNFFDTANTYARGTSEEFLGRALKNVAKREEVRIATKVFFNLTTPEHLTKKAIEAEIDGSLKRLGTDYVDLYQIHRFDKDTPIEETMEALHGLVKAGKVRAIGASAMYGYQFHNMQIAAEKHGWTPFSTMQNHYNLLYREDERELIPICQQMNVSLIPYSPLAAGRLSRLEWKTDTARSQTDKVAIGKYDSTQEQDYKIVKRVHEVAEKHNATMSQIAIAWHFAKGVTAPIIGATKPKYFDDAAAALDITLAPEDLAALEEFYVPHKIVGAL